MQLLDDDFLSRRTRLLRGAHFAHVLSFAASSILVVGLLQLREIVLLWNAVFRKSTVS